jgi:hypothetical protein
MGCMETEVIPDHHTQLSRLRRPDAIEDQGRYCQTKRRSELDVV